MGFASLYPSYGSVIPRCAIAHLGATRSVEPGMTSMGYVATVPAPSASMRNAAANRARV
ncbi:hypothetical protein FBZ93_109160 [Bradyrhizobium macuxiense]|uniref:Uncharacterized protein n=1 Tax=Bradyrhizobium macuxiense TaxID=1755647 RepID=A0A560LN20_9BRAD|nr:hypothetical protein FBZ93_109160 [Bradyrhizobium macuxiense]